MPSDQSFLREAIAKVTVETAKQMWPQKWGSFMSDLRKVYEMGVSSWMCLPMDLCFLNLIEHNDMLYTYGKGRMSILHRG